MAYDLLRSVHLDEDELWLIHLDQNQSSSVAQRPQKRNHREK